MPLERSSTEMAAPDEPHLALLTDASGLRTVIPPGASLWIVEDARDQSRIFPLTLKKVSHKGLTFVMLDAQGALVEYEYRLTKAKPLNREALLRLRKQANPNAVVQK